MAQFISFWLQEITSSAKTDFSQQMWNNENNRYINPSMKSQLQCVLVEISKTFRLQLKNDYTKFIISLVSNIVLQFCQQLPKIHVCTSYQVVTGYLQSCMPIHFITGHGIFIGNLKCGLLKGRIMIWWRDYVSPIGRLLKNPTAS